MKLSEEEIARGLAGCCGPQMRLNVLRVGPEETPLVLINDAYNANPDSMAAALRVLRQYPTAGRRVAILGDMAELGPKGVDLHRQLGDKVVESQIDVVIFIGRLSLFAAETVSRYWPSHRVHALPQWTDAVPIQVADQLELGDTVLLKASRVMGLERLIPAVEARWAASGNRIG